MPKADNDESLAELKRTIPTVQYKGIMGCFEKLWGGQSKNDWIPGSQNAEGVAVLTEANFIKNIKYVLGEGIDEPYFGKMIYLWMSRGFDRAKITINDFIEHLLPFRGEDKAKQHRLCFKILDLDHDKALNILNLLHLHKYLQPRTLL